jgi:hypothetical protein
MPSVYLGEPTAQDAKAWTGEKARSVSRRPLQFFRRTDVPVTVRRARRAADALRFE